MDYYYLVFISTGTCNKTIHNCIEGKRQTDSAGKKPQQQHVEQPLKALPQTLQQVKFN
jgi:hypothetical protein